MSTKIYNAYKFPKKLNIDELTKTVLAQKPLITIEAQKLYLNSYIRNFVRYYDELIQEGTFVYFLIDLNRMNETRREVRARLQKIFKLVAEKKFKDCGLKILATHFDEYTQKKKCSKDQAKNDIMELMEFDKIKGKGKIDFSKLILAVNLLDAKDIEIIKNEICALKK